MKLERYIDHTLLKPTATVQDIIKLCREAKTHNFFAACVNSSHVILASKELENTSTHLAAVVGFPLGAMAREAKMAEAAYSIDHGADEIDVVMNLGLFKSRQFNEVLVELSDLKKSIGNNVLKVIIETCYLSEEEIVSASKLVMESGADYVKTSTGFGSGGATLKDVSLMKDVVGDHIKIKASGGIRDRETALKYIDLGVSRLGTSSGIKIIQ